MNQEETSALEIKPQPAPPRPTREHALAAVEEFERRAFTHGIITSRQTRRDCDEAKDTLIAIIHALTEDEDTP